MYNIVYLVAARNDLLSIADYISNALLNEKASNDLIDMLDRYTSQLAQFPFMYPVYGYASVILGTKPTSLENTGFCSINPNL